MPILNLKGVAQEVVNATKAPATDAAAESEKSGPADDLGTAGLSGHSGVLRLEFSDSYLMVLDLVSTWCNVL